MFALVHAAYKVTVLLSLGLGLHLVADHARCSSPASSPCVFSVTSPALAVLLIALGLTLPAVVRPVSQLVRRRWEPRSVERLDRLWTDLSTAMPEIVLSPTEFGENSNDSDFGLRRRVIEISDGLLALRPYRYRDIKDAVGSRHVLPRRRPPCRSRVDAPGRRCLREQPDHSCRRCQLAYVHRSLKP